MRVFPRIICYVAFLSLLALVSSTCGAEATEEEKAAEKTLAAKGLKRVGTSLQLADELQFAKALADEKKFKKEVTDTGRLVAAAEKKEGLVRQEILQYRQRRRQINLLIDKAPSVDVHNRLVTEFNELGERIALLIENNPAEKELKEARDKQTVAREKYIEHVLATRKLADKITQKWSDLTIDTELKAAVETIAKATGKPLALAESTTLQLQLKSLGRIEDSVLSESIEMRDDGSDTFMVDVTINGKFSKQLAIDSGSTLISLPFKMASEMGLEPPGSAETIVLQLADGREVEAKRIKIPAVRVGKFIVENVEAAVMPADLPRAAPILGMSFLRNFKFDINAETAKLTLTRIEAPTSSVKKPEPKE